jgi:DAK2 domain fusion protein YloV
MEPMAHGSTQATIRPLPSRHARPPMLRRSVDGPTVMRAVRSAIANLEAHVDEVDALNVFPVPDGDTGSNMLATMHAALAEAERLPPDRRDLQSVAEALSRGALTGARGNSGVILSQIIRGMTHGADGRQRADGQHLARGLRRGSEVAYGSVLSPVEGTILTVIRDAAEAAESAAGRRPHVEAVLTQVIEAAADSVQRTPQLLPILGDAGVVDSGGQGLYRLFEGMVQVDGAPGRRDDRPLHGARTRTLPDAAGPGAPVAAVPELESQDKVPPQPSAPAPGATIDEPGDPVEHGYETEFLVVSDGRDIDVEALRAAITGVGGSVVVAGDERLVRVHVHGERPDEAIAVGLAWGRLSSVSVLDLDDQVAHAAQHDAPRPAHPPLRARAAGGVASTARTANPAPAVSLVAVTRADGLARVLESLGARVVRPAHGSRPSVGEIAEAILAVGSTQVIVLPNDGDALLAAHHAAELAALVEVAIIPTRNAAEGIAAAMAFDADGAVGETVERMRSEAEGLRSFTVVSAARDALVDGVPVTRGQLIAFGTDRRLLATGQRLADVTVAALGQLGDFELVTCYHGLRVDVAATQSLVESIESQGWDVEVELVSGGQRHDLLLVAVE